MPPGADAPAGMPNDRLADPDERRSVNACTTLQQVRLADRERDEQVVAAGTSELLGIAVCHQHVVAATAIDQVPPAAGVNHVIGATPENAIISASADGNERDLAPHPERVVPVAKGGRYSVRQPVPPAADSGSAQMKAARTHAHASGVLDDVRTTYVPDESILGGSRFVAHADDVQRGPVEAVIQLDKRRCICRAEQRGVQRSG